MQNKDDILDSIVDKDFMSKYDIKKDSNIYKNLINNIYSRLRRSKYGTFGSIYKLGNNRYLHIYLSWYFLNNELRKYFDHYVSHTDLLNYYRPDKMVIFSYLFYDKYVNSIQKRAEIVLNRFPSPPNGLRKKIIDSGINQRHAFEKNLVDSIFLRKFCLYLDHGEEHRTLYVGCEYGWISFPTEINKLNNFHYFIPEIEKWLANKSKDIFGFEIGLDDIKNIVRGKEGFISSFINSRLKTLC